MSSCVRRPSLFALPSLLFVLAAPAVAADDRPFAVPPGDAPAIARVDPRVDRVISISREIVDDRSRPVNPDATVTILEEGFEGDFPGAWEVTYQTGGPEAYWWPTTYRAAAGGKSAWCAEGGLGGGNPGGTYPPMMKTFLIAGPFSLADATAASATFALWLDSEPVTGGAYYDYVAWGGSTDGENFTGYRTAGNTGGWISKTLDFGALSNAPIGKGQVWFAFWFVSDDSVQREGAYVDALTIQKTAAAACTLTCGATVPATATAGSAVALSATATPSNCSGVVSYLWNFGDGQTSAQQNPSHAWTSAGSYPWTMTATIGGATCTKSGTITVTTGGGSTSTPSSLWIPVVAHAGGVGGSQWRSDLAILNGGSSPAAVEIRFHGPSGVLSRSTSVGAGAQHLAGDVVGSFGVDGSGALELVCDRPVMATLRTYNQGTSGTLGQGFEGASAAKGLSAGESAVLPQLAENGSYRTNVAVTNAGSTAARVRFELFAGTGGAALTSWSVDLAPGQWKQDTQPFKNRAGQTNLARGWGRITVESGSGLFAYASVIDNRTQDPTTLSMKRVPEAGSMTAWLPVVAHSAGAAGSQWRSDVGVLNPGSGTATIDLVLHGSIAVAPVRISVPAGNQAVEADVFRRFGETGAGTLEIRSDRPVVVSSRTYNEATGGTFGQDIDATAAALGSATGGVFFLPQLAENAAYRSNIALANLGTEAASAKVELFGGSGTKLGQYTVDLASGQQKQAGSPFRQYAGQSDLANGWAKVTVTAGSGVVGYGSVVDNVTSDPTTIAPKRAGSTYTLVTNATDSEILRVAGDDGTLIRYYGSRDADGIPTGLDRMTVAAPDGGVTSIGLDASLRPSTMRDPDGAWFTLAYPGGNEAVVSAVAPDGSVQVNTRFVLGSSGAAGRCSTDVAALADAIERALWRQAAAPPSPEASEAQCIVTVNRCGTPVDDAVVNVQVQTPGSLFLAWQGTAEGLGGGRYEVYLPTTLKPSLAGEKIRQAAETIAGYLGSICDVLSATGNPQVFLASMCPAVGLALVTVTGPGAVAITKGCLAVSGAVTAYCATLGEGGVPGNASLAERIFQGLQDPEIFSGTIDIKAVAYVPGLMGGDVSPNVTAPAIGPFPTVPIEVLDKGRIGSLTLNPASPVAWQAYTITVEILCAAVDDYVRIQVRGTDGYAKDFSETITSPGTKSYSLGIPGGASGVKDTVMVELQTAQGTERRDASLVFSGGSLPPPATGRRRSN